MKTTVRAGFMTMAVLAGAAILFIFSNVNINGPTAWAQDEGGPASSVHFEVVRESDGKPIKYAQVVVHSVNRQGKASKEEMELKTDVDGRASLDGIPYGSVQVQVLAKGFQTFGEDYPVDKPSLEITVKLKHPAGQFSVYDDKKPQ